METCQTITAPSPVRLRATRGDAIGTTAFFRNRPLLQLLIKRLGETGQRSLNLLFHACSIGAEIYSFAIAAELSGLFQQRQVNLFATDREAAFLQFAAAGCYPVEVLGGMTDAERNYFSRCDAQVTVSPGLRQRVTFLPPCDFSTAALTGPFDVVFLLNALIYVPEAAQARTLDLIADYNPGLLVATGFHQQTIETDLRRHGYTPDTETIELIHDGWLDRRCDTPSTELRPQIFADWQLPPFSRIEGYEYRFCALFSRQSLASTSNRLRQ